MVYLIVSFYFGRRLLECLLVLLSSPQTSTDPAVFAGVRDLLLYFVSFQQGTVTSLVPVTHSPSLHVGLLLLSSNSSVVNLIIRALTQSAVSSCHCHCFIVCPSVCVVRRMIYLSMLYCHYQ